MHRCDFNYHVLYYRIDFRFYYIVMYTTLTTYCDFVTLRSRSHDPNTYKVKRTVIYYDETQHANFRGRPFFQTIRQQLNDVR